MQYNHPGGVASPAKVGAVANSATANATVPPVRVEVEVNIGTKLLPATTYYFTNGQEASTLTSFHIHWDAAAILTITVEDSNMSHGVSADHDTTPGYWTQQNPSTAYVAISPAGSGAATNATVAVAGGTSGSAMIHFTNTASSRLRLKVVVGATGGTVIVATYGKE